MSFIRGKGGGENAGKCYIFIPNLKEKKRW